MHFFKRRCLTEHVLWLTHWQNVFLKLVLKTALVSKFWKFCKTCRNTSMTEFTVKEVTVFRVATFWMKCSAKYNFLGI